MQSRVLATALIGLSVLCVTGCRTTRISRDRITAYERRTITNDARDSLREEILQNLRENLTERDSVTEKTLVTVTLNEKGDTIFRSVVTDRVKVRDRDKERSRDNIAAYRTSSKEKRDSVVEEKRDSLYVETTTNFSNDTNEKREAVTLTLKWIFAIIMGLLALAITVKVCLRK